MSLLTVGDPAPEFSVPSSGGMVLPDSGMGGHWSLLFFLGSSRLAQVPETLQTVCALQEQFERCNLSFFGVSIDPQDIYLKELVEATSHCRLLWDFERAVSSQYGVCQSMEAEGVSGHLRYKLTTFVVDRNLRIRAVFPFEEPEGYIQRILAFVEAAAISPTVSTDARAIRQAPVLFVPQTFDPSFCQQLIDRYHTDGGKESGFMQVVGNQTTEVVDHQVKRRRDLVLTDPALLKSVNDLIWRRVKPEIEKAFQFTITYFERYVVACYDGTNQGYFKPHRDNTMPGTGHRRFAMTLNLNAAAYTGGELRFPEYGASLYRPETGEAIIFSCSLLHEATPVTQGQRFALLTFFYGDAEAKLREQEQQHIVFQPGAIAQTTKNATTFRLHDSTPVLPASTRSNPGPLPPSPSGFQLNSKKKPRKS